MVAVAAAGGHRGQQDRQRAPGNFGMGGVSNQVRDAHPGKQFGKGGPALRRAQVPAGFLHGVGRRHRLHPESCRSRPTPASGR